MLFEYICHKLGYGKIWDVHIWNKYMARIFKKILIINTNGYNFVIYILFVKTTPKTEN